MPLTTETQDVEALITELQSLTGGSDRQAVVRSALEREIERHRDHEQTVARRRAAIAEAQARVRALGPRDPDFDQKVFFDEMWASDVRRRLRPGCDPQRGGGVRSLVG